MLSPSSRPEGGLSLAPGSERKHCLPSALCSRRRPSEAPIRDSPLEQRQNALRRLRADARRLSPGSPGSLCTAAPSAQGANFEQDPSAARSRWVLHHLSRVNTANGGNAEHKLRDFGRCCASGAFALEGFAPRPPAPEKIPPPPMLLAAWGASRLALWAAHRTSLLSRSSAAPASPDSSTKIFQSIGSNCKGETSHT